MGKKADKSAPASAGQGMDVDSPPSKPSAATLPKGSKRRGGDSDDDEDQAPLNDEDVEVRYSLVTLSSCPADRGPFRRCST